MTNIFGDLKSFKASERDALVKLAGRRSAARDVIDHDLARRSSALARQLDVHVGLLIDREGHTTQVVVGTKNRIYLPDLGRLRTSQMRLRGLRLVVFAPSEDRLEEVLPEAAPLYASLFTPRRLRGRIVAPVVTSDLVTDLEKLRLDMLLVVAVTQHGEPGSAALLYLTQSEQPQRAAQAPLGPRRNVERVYAPALSQLNFDCSRFLRELDAQFRSTEGDGYDLQGERAVLVGAYTSSAAEAQASMDELKELARTAGLAVADSVMQRKRTLDPRTILGKGKIEELVLHCLDRGADLVVFDRELTPSQLRSVTKLTDLRVIDRSMLILDIFAQRAVSSEGRMQVELAQLKYSLPRLTETDSGLSRLTGGIGGRGPGETKLEISRRRARDRIVDLERRIDRLANQRGLRRERRQSRGVPVVSIVGYTNAGKSTLLNALTKGDTLVENKLFATLDPSSRRMRFPNDKEVVFVDTVGFIRELPKELVAAFRATLEEVGEADVLVHVVDVANPEFRNHISVVSQTLESLGYGDKPSVLVFNKIDSISEFERQTALRNYDAVPISALKREGLEELLRRVQEVLIYSVYKRDPGGFAELPQPVPEKSQPARDE